MTDNRKIESSPGPLVGILIAHENNRSSCYPRGKKAKVYKELMTCGEEHGVLVFIFSPPDVDKIKKTIKGITYHHKAEKWVSALFPIPDIVYNRIPYRSLEKSAAVQSISTYLQKLDTVYFFNTRFLDKWELYSILQKESPIADLVPESQLLSPETLASFIKKHGVVYIKPRHNSRGQGIIKAKTIPDGYCYTRVEDKGKKWRECKTARTIIRGLIPNRYIMQAAVDLAEYQGRVFDLRAQVQKDGHGHWVMTGVGARVAALNHIVTHIPNGGYKERFQEVLDYLYPQDKRTQEHIHKQLLRICKSVPPVLESSLSMNLGILSLDIGLDKNGKLWLIEANSKPASFDEDDIRKVHTENLVDYFIYCAKHNRVSDSSEYSKKDDIHES